MKAFNLKKISIKFVLLLLLLSLIAGEERVLYRLNNSTKKIDSFDINLDLPVHQRYKEILIKYTPQIKAGISLLRYTSINAQILSLISEYIIKSPSNYDPEWLDYLKAVSKYVNLTLSEAILYSITYDMACTSIITQDRNGTIILSRNLDFDNYHIIAHSVFQANYYKGGKLIFSGIELAGFRGLINGVKNNKFAMSLNLRIKNFSIFNIIRIFKGFSTPNYFLYKVMLEANSYDEAYKKIKEEKISAPVYYTLAGTKKDEGVLLIRDFDNLDGEEKLDSENGKWFIVISNYDKDQEDPITDYRRTPAEKKLEIIGIENINKENLFNEIMSQYPNNNLLTAYTTIHSAQNGGYMNTTIWLP